MIALKKLPATSHFFYFVCIIILFSSCASIQPVKVSGVKNFKTADLLSNPKLNFDLGIKNPNKFGVTVKRMGIDVYMGDSVLTGVKIPAKTRIAAHSDVQIPVSLNPSVNSIAAMALGGFKNLFSGSGKSEIDVRGEIVMRKFIFTKKIKIDEKIKF